LGLSGRWLRCLVRAPRSQLQCCPKSGQPGSAPEGEQEGGAPEGERAEGPAPNPRAEVAWGCQACPEAPWFFLGALGVGEVFEVPGVPLLPTAQRFRLASASLLGACAREACSHPHPPPLKEWREREGGFVRGAVFFRWQSLPRGRFRQGGSPSGGLQPQRFGGPRYHMAPDKTHLGPWAFRAKGLQPPLMGIPSVRTLPCVHHPLVALTFPLPPHF